MHDPLLCEGVWLTRLGSDHPTITCAQDDAIINARGYVTHERSEHIILNRKHYYPRHAGLLSVCLLYSPGCHRTAFTAWIAFTQQVISCIKVADFDVKASL